MLLDVKKRNCLCCGREFTYMHGGFILLPPVCPECMISVSMPLKKLFK